VEALAPGAVCAAEDELVDEGECCDFCRNFLVMDVEVNGLVWVCRRVVDAGAGVAEVVDTAGGVVGSAVAAVVAAEAVVEDGEWRAGTLAGWGAFIGAGDDIISCMGNSSFFVTESAIEWSKGPVKVMSKPVALCILHLPRIAARRPQCGLRFRT